MFKLNVKFDAYLLLYSLSHFECDSHTVHMLINGIYRPHWLVQWSHHCSCMCIPVLSPWVPGHIGIIQTVLVIFTMIKLFLDRPGICLNSYFQRFYLFIFKEWEREGERVGETYQYMVAFHAPPTGDLACNPGMCLDWESNKRPFGF